MTADTTWTDRTAAPDSEFAEVLAAIEAAPAAEESLRERVARAIHAADEIVDYPGRTWEDDAEDNREDYRHLADAAIAVMRGEQP